MMSDLFLINLSDVINEFVVISLKNSCQIETFIYNLNKNVNVFVLIFCSKILFQIPTERY